VNYTDIFGSELHLAPFRTGGVRDKITGNIFVKNLPGETKSAEVHQLFAPFGKIFSCRVKYNPNGKCKGYGYVQFDTKEAADKAVAEINGKQFKGSVISVEPFKAREARGASFTKYNNLFVKNIPRRFTDKDLISLFQSYGEIVSAVVIKESPDAKENKGFGFVCYKKAEDAKTAEEKLKNMTIEGQNLYVCRALSKEAHRAELRKKRLETFRDCNLYVKELPEDINDEKLKKAFEEFGKVVSARVMLEKKQDLTTGKTETKSKGFGFVCFNSKEEAKKALEAIQKQPILGKQIYAAIAESKEVRQARMQTMMMMPFPGGMYPPMYGMPPQFGYPPHPHAGARRPRFVFL